MSAMTTLRPGLLVSLRTSVAGNVSYIRQDLEASVGAEGEARARWETERVITDPIEHEAARKAQAKASSLIRGVCKHSAFGLLCPEQDGPELEKAIAEARKVTEAFNAVATLSRVSVNVITGRIAPDDVEAVKAINGELRELLGDMERGISNLDVKVVRDAASRAKNIGAMLSTDAQARVQIAVDAARGAARKMVAAGEQAAMEIDRRAIAAITEQRTAFLDIDEGKAVAAPKEAVPSLDLSVA